MPSAKLAAASFARLRFTMSEPASMIFLAHRVTSADRCGMLSCIAVGCFKPNALDTVRAISEFG
jgi:hypothetical protein